MSKIQSLLDKCPGIQLKYILGELNDLPDIIANYACQNLGLFYFHKAMDLPRWITQVAMNVD